MGNPGTAFSWVEVLKDAPNLLDIAVFPEGIDRLFCALRTIGLILFGGNQPLQLK
jgi:hypothetical protein